MEKVVHIQTTVLKDGSITIEKLPFQEGIRVEVTVRAQTQHMDLKERYPLRGQPVKYIDPFEGVAQDDWAALR
jgi:hypothetical protein